MGPDEGLRRHTELVTALESNDPQIVLEALREHGGQRYLRFRPAPTQPASVAQPR